MASVLDKYKEAQEENGGGPITYNPSQPDPAPTPTTTAPPPDGPTYTPRVQAPPPAPERPDVLTPAGPVYGGGERQADADVQTGAFEFQEMMKDGAIPTLAEQEADEAKAEQVSKMLNFLARAWYVGNTEDDEEMRDMVSSVLVTFEDDIDPWDLRLLGLDEAMPEDPEGLRLVVDTISSGIARTLGGNPFGEFVMKVLEPIANIGEGAALGLGATLRGDPLKGGQAALRGLVSGEQDADLVASMDRNEDGTLNMREVLGIDPDWGGDGWMGLVVGALDTAGLAAISPDTYLMMTPGRMASAGLEAAERVGGKALMRRVMESGYKGLDDGVINAINREITQSIEAAWAQGKSLSFADRMRQLDAAAAREREVRRVIAQAEKPTGRFSFAGRNIRSPLDTVIEAMPGRRAWGEITEAGNVLDTAASGVRRGIARIFGEGVDTVSRSGSGLRVEGRILDSQGRDVGSFNRTLNNDGTAVFDHSGIDPDFQRRGHAARFLEEQIEGLEQEGFHTIKMVAEGDGALVWGRQGFEFDVTHPQFEPSMRSLSDRLRAKADELEAATGAVPPPRTDRALLPGERMATDGDSQLDALADEGIGMYPGGSPDELRMLADEIDIALRTGQTQLLPSPSSQRWGSLAGVVDDTMGFPMVRKLNPVEGAQGRVARFLEDPDSQMGQRYGAEVVNEGVASRIPERLRRSMDWMRPRAAIKRSGDYGDALERRIDDARIEAAAVGAKLYNQMAQELNARATKAAAEFGETSGNAALTESIASADEYVRAALEGDEYLLDVFGYGPDARDTIDPDEFAERVAASLDSTRPETANYIRAAVKWRNKIDDASVNAGLDAARRRRFYMPRTLTREGQSFITDHMDDVRVRNDFGATSGGSTLGEFGYQNERVFRPDAPLAEVNDALAAKYGLPEGTKVFDDSVLGSFATRGRSAFRASVEADIFRAMQDELVDGRPLAILDDGSKAARDAAESGGYHRVSTSSGDILMPKDVAAEFEATRRALHSDEWTQGLDEFRKNWSQIWGAWATSPLIDGIGFHSRNATGNLMLNALAGVVNPDDYRRAQQVQLLFGKAQRRVKDGSSTWDSVWDDLGVDAQQRALIDGLIENDIMGGGFFDDIIKGTTDRGKIYEFLGNNTLIRQGRYIGNLVEDNARIAHYISKLDAPGGSPASAARSVRKFLFDYNDLTEFERRLRHVSRFYTFMRKNTGVQLWALAHAPGRVSQLEEIQQDTRDSGIGQALGLNQPDYSLSRGDTMRAALGLEGTVSGIETPFGAAMNTVSGAYEALNMLPGLRDLLPGESTKEDLVRALYNLASGGEVAFVDAVYETLTNQSVFTGAPLDDEGNEKIARKWVDALIGPAWSQLDSIVGRATEGEGIQSIGGVDTGVLGALGNNMSEASAEIGHELLILSNLLGFTVAPIGDDQRTSHLYAINAYLQDELEGTPTITQLRDTGVLERPDNTRTTLNSDVTARKLEEARAQGLPTDDLEAKLQEQLAYEEANAVRYEEDGTVTSRGQRIQSYALGLGLANDDGTGSDRRLAEVLYNQAHPDDPVIDPDDGQPYDEYDIPVVWDMPRQTELKEWAIEVGGPLTPAGNVGAETIRAWNTVHPDRPYVHDKIERIQAGIRPLEGVYEVFNDDGVKVGDWRPEGGGFYDPSVLSGTAALVPPAPSGTSALAPSETTSAGPSALTYPGAGS